MLFDFTEMKVIDSHGHPFLKSREKKPYERGFCMNTYEESANDLKYIASYRMVLQEFKRLFKMPIDATDEEVMEKRYEIANRDYKAFVKMLFDDCKVVTLLSDYGYPVSAATLNDNEINEFNELIDGIIDTYDIVRIETTSDRLYKQGMSFEDFLIAFDEYLEDHIKNYRTVGMKSVIGYYTGLNINEVDKADARKAFNAYYGSDRRDAESNKKFRDFMVFHGLELCEKHDLVLQMHTGAGDAPMSDLRTMNPNCLYEVINSKIGQKVKIVMVHAGVSYCMEAAYLAHSYTNVFLDLSCIATYCGSSIERKLPDILDWCPHNKLMYGSDVGGLVDEAWFGTVYFKRVLAEELDRRVTRNQFTKGYAEMIAEWIFTTNAERIYKLK